MELRELVEQIMAKVMERLPELEEKPKLLILSEAHGAECHELWEKESLKQKYDVVCALSDEYRCDVRQFDVILLKTLSNTALGKITQGVGDCPFTELVIKAVLLGKQIVAFHEGTEIFRYRETAPKPYYDMMIQKVELLKSSGIRFCTGDQIKSMILENGPLLDGFSLYGPLPYGLSPDACENSPGESIKFEKRIITERDVQSADERRIKRICITDKTIITDLAREYADRRGISFTAG